MEKRRVTVEPEVTLGGADKFTNFQDEEASTEYEYCDDSQSEDSESLTDFDDADIEEDGDDLFWKKAEEIVAVRQNVDDDLRVIQVHELGAIVNEDDGEQESDFLPSGSDCDEQDERRFTYFNENTGFKSEFELVVGMQFKNHMVFRKALKYYAIRKGFDYDFIDNKKARISAQCRSTSCPWRIRGSWHQFKSGSRVFQIKILGTHGDCPRDLNNAKVTSRFLAEYYISQFKDNPKWEVEAFRRHVKRDLAVARDGNDNMFPIAYAICEAETKETWLWFIERLLSDIGEGIVNGWTFISDQQKGLVEALKQLVPYCEHRLCVRHLYANFSKLHKGKELKDAMWAAARATTVSTHDRAMRQLKEFDKDAFTYLQKLDKASWCKHAFSYHCLSDSLCSNISECWNAFIKDARTEPIITCLEIIRKLLMKRFMDKFRGMQNYEGYICPRIWKKLETNKRESMTCESKTGGSSKFQVESVKWGTYVVDLSARSCGCRMWDLTGIPCVHACSAISYTYGSHDAYVHQTYSKLCFLKTYQYIVEPIPGVIEWPVLFEESVLPPVFRKQAGRPKKKRKRHASEQNTSIAKSRVGTLMHCGRCNEEGHNQRNCQKDVTDPKATAAAKANASRVAQYRTRQKIVRENPLSERTSATGQRDGNVAVKKAKTNRKVRESTPVVMRDPPVALTQSSSRGWQRSYTNSDGAMSYIPPQSAGPVIYTRIGGGTAMFTRKVSSTPNSDSNTERDMMGSSSSFQQQH